MLLGVVICSAVIFLYMQVVSRIWPPRQPAPTSTTEPAESTPAQPAVISPQAPPAAPATAPAAPAAPTTPAARPTTPPAKVVTAPVLPEQPVKDDIVCETTRFRAVLTNRGAAIKSITLRDYYLFPQDDPQPGKGDLKLITEIEKDKFSLTMAAQDGVGNLDTVVWQYVPNCPVPEGFTKAERFLTRLSERNLDITKTFLFREPEQAKDGSGPVRGRDIQIQIDVRNLGTEAASFAYRVRSAAGIVPEPDMPPTFPIEQRQSRDVAAVACGLESDNSAELEEFGIKKVKDGSYTYHSAKARLVYAGVKNRYFAAVLQPLTEQAGIRSVLLERISENNITASLDLTTEQIPAGGTGSRRFLLLVTPRLPERLREYKGYHFGALLHQGMLGPIKKVLTWLLQMFHKVIPNYGVAIILLTLCVRGMLHPLTRKSQRAMFKMQKLQPLVKATQEKYKHDKRLQQQETMKLYREHGANPFGGCLPMLLQLPIFIGLWRSLYENANLRHAPFILWIQDLSKADNLFDLPAALPVLGSSFNLLPLLCAIVMVVQQKLSPKSKDPQAQQQQKIMMFMPVFFAVMLYSMPAGLMMYFLCSSSFGLLEQQWIRRGMQQASEAEPAPAPVPVEPKRQKPAPQKRKKRRRR